MEVVINFFLKKKNRLLASSLIPISKDSLIYGSSNGGITIVSKSNEMNQKIQLIAKLLNLQGIFYLKKNSILIIEKENIYGIKIKLPKHFCILLVT